MNFFNEHMYFEIMVIELFAGSMLNCLSVLQTGMKKK